MKLISRDRTTYAWLDPLPLQQRLCLALSCFLDHNFTCQLTVAFTPPYEAIQRFALHVLTFRPQSRLKLHSSASRGESRSLFCLCEHKTDGLSGPQPFWSWSASALCYIIRLLSHGAVYMFPQQVLEECLLIKLSYVLCLYPPVVD